MARRIESEYPSKPALSEVANVMDFKLWRLSKSCTAARVDNELSWVPIFHIHHFNPIWDDWRLIHLPRFLYETSEPFERHWHFPFLKIVRRVRHFYDHVFSQVKLTENDIPPMWRRMRSVGQNVAGCPPGVARSK